MIPKALFVDFDGVIRHWPKSDAEIELRCNLPAGILQKTAFDPHLLNQAITGKISDEDWRTQVTKHIQIAYPDSLAAEAVHQFTNKPAKIDDAILKLLKQFRTGRAIYLITNATSRLTRDLTALGLVDFFDGVINSSEVGVAKPEEKLFHFALSIANVTASEAIFIDDAAKNVAAASAMGIRSHHFVDHDGLQSFLNRTCADQY